MRKGLSCDNEEEIRQQWHNLKKKVFDPFPLHRVTKTSSLKCMSNDEWIDLIESWKSPKNMLCLFLKS